MSEAPKVDMLAIARDAQWSADTFLGAGSIKLVSPAKVNLFLGVGARRSDGYHDVTNVMHAVTLHDVMYVRCAPAGAEAFEGAEGKDHLAVGGPGQNVLVSIDLADKAAAAGLKPLRIPARENIIFKAIDALACALGRTQREQVSVRVEKNIPHEGGLGGGSSNAATALVAMAGFWGLASDDDTVAGVARSLGADVAFFLYGGCALFTGAGEVFGRALSPRKDSVVLVKPPAGVSTAAAYRAFDESPQLVSARLSEQALAAAGAAEVPLVNNLAPVSEQLSPELAEVRAWLEAQPGVRAGEVLLCGSGATTFAVMKDFAAACAVAAAAQARGWWARATTFSSLRSAKLPRR
ncbi:MULTISPECIES: 4-(cytidine 5'-diphospho)-2-C-methyl-D-erythritol kinase [unclassified Adlercreutzia]|uniref:4-(cytidine 5'-diphospho)-2-C-methyl-D-erythritol kinase n=1 Tax=unclassified Adlercreutzia TaxID=2636013 RepID=UPI001F14F8FC|nr:MULTISPECIES: 4-(cytidine 5'-diphospho)-2-C-methyl-D-erythritol kinase [unclassified Adlercreutzia]